MPAFSTPFLLSTGSHYLGSTGASRRLRFLDGAQEKHRHAVLSLTADGRLVDPRAPGQSYVADAEGRLARQAMLGVSPEGDRFARVGRHLVHRDSGRVVSAAPAANGAASLVLGDSVADAAPIDVTDFSLITNVLGMPQTGYQAFTGPEAVAYSYACALWQVDDIRAQYATVYDLDGKTYLFGDDYFPPNQNNFQLADWQAMGAILQNEISAVDNVRNLYDAFNTFSTKVFDVKSNLLTLISDELQIDTTANYTMWPVNLVEGIFYALFSAMGPECAFLANVMSAAFNTAVSTGTFSPDPITEEYTNLLGSLVNNYQAVTNEAANQETLILQNWNMTQTVSLYTGGPLAMNPTQLAQAEGIAETGFAAYALQGFLPQIASIQANICVQGDAVDDDPAVWIQTLTSELYNRWTVVLNATGANVPASIMNYIWGADIPRQDFFYGLNNWNIARDHGTWTVGGWSGAGSTNNTAVLLVLFANETDQDLTVTTTDPVWQMPQSMPLPAGGTTMFAAISPTSPAITANVMWSGYPSGPAAGLTVSQTVGTFGAGTVSTANYYARTLDILLAWKIAEPYFDGIIGNMLGLPGMCVITVGEQS